MQHAGIFLATSPVEHEIGLGQESYSTAALATEVHLYWWPSKRYGYGLKDDFGLIHFVCCSCRTHSGIVLEPILGPKMDLSLRRESKNVRGMEEFLLAMHSKPVMERRHHCVARIFVVPLEACHLVSQQQHCALHA